MMAANGAMNFKRLLDDIGSLLEIQFVFHVALLTSLLLTLALAIRWSTTLADTIRFTIAWWLRSIRFPKGSTWQDWATQLADRLAPSPVSETNKNFKRTKTLDELKPTKKNSVKRLAKAKPIKAIGSWFSDYQELQEIASNRFYTTHLGTSQDMGKYVIKIGKTVKGNHLLQKEKIVIDRLRRFAKNKTYRHYLPHLKEQFEHQGHCVNVFSHNPNDYYSAFEIARQYPQGLGGEHIAWMFNRILTGIGFAHRQGTVHAAVMPQHLLFNIQSHGLEIVDWTHAKRIGNPFGKIARRYRSWYPPEATPGRTAKPETDIYMAAKSIVYLAGGQDRIAERLPKPMRCFLKACLIEAPNMRPNNAWELQEEFSELLGDIFGPPEFHLLVISKRRN